ncbi:TPA: hypothetical protein ACTW9I_000678 [Raoultella planticola]
MTVSTEVDHNDYTGNGVTTSFPYTFRIFQKTDLMVQVVDLSENISVLVLDTDYSVTGAGTYSGGSVVLSTPLANGWQISIARDLPATQETDLRNQGKFFAEVHENAFDKLTMLIQQCFSFLRLALRKPSFIANYYDAMNNRIRNLRDPSQAQDAATKNYVDGQITDNTNAWKAGDAVLDQKIDANFIRTLRVPESSVNILPPADFRKGKVHTYDNATGQPLLIPAGQLSVGDILNLSSADGLKYIGKCPSIATLRTIEPTYYGQSITLERAVSGGPTVNAIITHDPADTTSPDDGMSVFVTPGGARWKADISEGYCAGLAGILANGSNITTIINGMVNKIVDKIVANGQVNNVMRRINVPVLAPINVFTLTGEIYWPTIISIIFNGNTLLDYRAIKSGKALHYKNNAFSDRLTVAMMAKGTNPPDKPGQVNQATGRCGLDCIGGEINLIGPGIEADGSGNPTVFTTGIVIGNDAPCDLDARDVFVRKLNIIGFHTTHEWGIYNTFMCGIEESNFSRSHDGGLVPGIGSNYGERMYYRNCTFGNLTRHGMNMIGGGDYTLENVSTDFIDGDLAHFGPQSPAEYKHLSGHIEGVKGQLAAKDTPTSFSKAFAYFGKLVRRDDRVVSSGDYRGVRQLFGCPQSSFGRVLKVINESYAPGRENTKPNNAYPCETGWPGNSGVEPIIPGSTFVDTPYINSYNPAVRNSVNATITFTEASTGNLGTNIVSTDYAFAAIVTGGATCRYGTAADATGDGVMPFILTLTDPSDSIELFCTNRFRPESGISQLWGACSVRIGAATGNIMISPLMAVYLGQTGQANLTTGAVTINPIQRVISEGGAVNMTDLFSGSGLAAGDYQAMVPRSVTGYYLGSNDSVAGFKITGGVGEVRIKLPVWWHRK